jgi:NADP-dependent 3-hydroxy acid dehydrogenase YdfG
MAFQLTATARVFITGASSGVGAAIARRLARSSTGAKRQFFLVGRNEGRLLQVKAELGEGVASFVGVGDVSRWADVQRLMTEAEESMGGVDVLVANAGCGVKGTLEEVSVEEYDRVMDTNVKGVFLCLKRALPGMRTRRSGQVVVMSSVCGFRPSGGSSIYCASKYALEGMVACVRQELDHSGVRIGLVNPAAIDTPWWDEYGKSEADRKRMLSADDVARAVEYFVEQSPSMDLERIVLDPSTHALTDAGEREREQ